MNLPSHSVILFAGDSITDCGRDPSGGATPWNHATGLGRGYVSLINGWLFATRPQDLIRVRNCGVSGRTVRDLKNNWANEVLANPPDWLSVMIGINDVWRQFDTPTLRETHVSLAEYRTTLDELLAKTRPVLKGLVLASPYMIEPNRADPMRALMDQYGAAVRELAGKYDAVFVDTQAAFDAVLQFRHPMEISWDRIHSDTVGHSILARAWLQTAGLL